MDQTIDSLLNKAISSRLTEDDCALARYLLELSECLVTDAMEEAFLAYDWMILLGTDGLDSAHAALCRAERTANHWTEKHMIGAAWCYMSAIPGATKEYCMQRALVVQEDVEREVNDSSGYVACACARMHLTGPESQAIAWNYMMKAEKASSDRYDAHHIVIVWLLEFGYEGYCEAKRFMNTLISESEGMENLHFHLPQWFWNIAS